MALITVGILGNQTISQSETDSVVFLGAGTLNIVGTPGAPIDVTLSQVAGAGVANTINVSNATVHLLGVAGVSALTDYNIGDGGTLDIGSAIGISAGSSIDFTGQTGRLIVEPGIDISLLTTLGGFGPGKSIDFGGLQVASVSYADAAGNDTGGTLTLFDAANTPLGTIQLSSGELRTPNFDLRTDGTGGTLLSFASAVTSITATPANSTLGLNGTVTLTVAMSDPVTITGTPQLTLDDGGRAIYDPAASTATQLVFRYTVGAGQNTADLRVTGIDLTGATATTAGGFVNTASFAVNPAGTLAVETTAPVATSLVTDVGTGSLGAGQGVIFTATLSEPITIVGLPVLQLTDGGVALLDPVASTPTQLVFRTTVLAGQNTADLAVTAVTTTGVTATDAAGNAFDWSSLMVNPAGVLSIDTTAPTVTGVSTSPGSGQVGTGSLVRFTVAVSEAVQVMGTAPLLLLSDGGTATFNAAGSTATTLAFDHTVQAGQSSADLAITGVTVSGTTIADAAANQLNLAAAIGNPLGTLVVDTSGNTGAGMAPVVVSVTTTPGSGALGAGDTVRVVVTTDHAVTVAGGTPTLSLSDGGTATFDPTASGPTTLSFTHVVQPGQTAADLAVTGYDLKGATIRDANGLPLSLMAAEVNPPGVLSVGNQAGGGNGTPAPGGSDGQSDQTGSYSTIPIYRFFDSRNGTHFFTPSSQERATILATRPDLIPEGPGGVGLRAVNPASQDPNAVEVFRFFDKIHGTQFLTASTSERDNVIATRPDLVFEPQGSFFEHTQPQPNDTPVYRFFSATDGTHFYTDSKTEVATILQTRPDLIAEGIGFYEPR